LNSTVSTQAEVRRRLDVAMARSRLLCSYAGRLMASSKQARVSAERARVTSITLRGAGSPPIAEDVEGEVQGFAVDGFVDGRPASARYADGHLWCSAEVAQLADVVVALGETFDPGDGGPVVRASLDTTPTAALLTVVRAFSRVSSVELGLGRPVSDE
jgi:hypothetical protein